MARSEKEAILLVLDVSISMSTRVNLNSTYLETCADMIQMIIQRKMFQSSKDEIGLILFGTNETANDLYDRNSDHYSHIVLAKPISEVDWKLLEYIQKNVHTTNIEGDLFDALTVAADHLHETSTKRKYTEKRIIIFSDYSTLSEDQNIDDICDALKNDSVRLDIVSPFDELKDDDGDDEKPKKHKDRAYNDENEDDDDDNFGKKNKIQKKLMTDDQIKNQKLLRKIVIETDGALYSFNEVLTMLSLYQAKSVKSSGTKYTLDIGENFRLPIISMIKVKENKPELFRFKKVYAKDDNVVLKTDRSRFTKDDEQRDLNDKTEVVDAFRYGSTYVPVDDADMLRYQVEKGFSLLGFTKAENIKRHYFLGDSVHQIIPDSANCGDDGQKAFLSMVEAMYEENVYGIVRKVFNARSSPEMGCLIPFIDKDITCLLYIELPYEDDIRKFTLENFTLMKKFKPNETQLDLVDDLIDSMDLTKVKNDNDDENEEAYNPHTTFNPYIQRMFQTIALRGNDPNADLPDFEKHITTNYLKIYENKIRNDRTNDLLKRCADAFPTRVIETKKAKLDATEIFNNKKEAEKTDVKKEVDDNKDLNIDNLYTSVTNSLNKVKKIGTINPVNDFNVLIQNCDIDNDFTQICEQLINLIKEILTESLQQQQSDAYQLKVIDCVKGLREACLKYSKVSYFNEVLVDFKKYLFESSEMKKYLDKLIVFFKNYFVASNLTLITKTEDGLSQIDGDEAKKFLELPKEDEIEKNDEKVEKENEDVEDLLDLM